MYWISRDTETPDIEKLKSRICETMREGVRVHDIADERARLIKLANTEQEKLIYDYGISNPNSPKQVMQFIENNADDTVYGICYDEKSGKWSSKNDLIGPLADMGYAWARHLVDYRKYNKMVEGIDSIKSACDADGFIHPIVDILKTNRISYSKPALMNINKELLWKLIAPRNAGNQLWSVDIKNQEPWILINMLDIKGLKETMARAVQKKIGLYQEIYFEIYGHECESDVEYKEMKRGWNMLTYGGSKVGLKKYCKHIDADKLYRFFNDIPEMKQYKDKTWKMAKYNEQTVETYFGTEVCADKLGYGLQRTLMDLPIQGTGADILALLIEHLFEEIESMGLDGKLELYFTRHDEVVIEVNREWAESVGAEEVENVLREIFEHRIDDWEPFGLEVNRVA